MLDNIGMFYHLSPGHNTFIKHICVPTSLTNPTITWGGGFRSHSLERHRVAGLEWLGCRKVLGSIPMFTACRCLTPTCSYVSQYIILHELLWIKASAKGLIIVIQSILFSGIPVSSNPLCFLVYSMLIQPERAWFSRFL